MSAKLLKKLSNFWTSCDEDEATAAVGFHVFYSNMEELKRVNIKDGAIAMQTTSGFWVRKDDHVGYGEDGAN